MELTRRKTKNRLVRHVGQRRLWANLLIEEIAMSFKRFRFENMPVHTSAILAFCIVGLSFCLNQTTVRADGFTKEFFVAVDGNDASDGSETAPFATLERARDAIRSERVKGKNGTYCVRLSAGEYQRTGTFSLNSLDSNTCYIGVENQTTISGGRMINGWKVASPEQKKKFPNPEAEIWRAELPDIHGRPFFFEQLFVNDRRATRSRFPNTGFLRPASVWQESQESAANGGALRQEIRAKDGDLDELALADVPISELRFAQFLIHHNWNTTRRILLGFNKETNALLAKGEPMIHWNPWRDTSLYYLENLRTSFDVPGEWFYDGVDNCVYYRPLSGEKIETTRFIAPVSGLNQLLTVSGDSDSAEGKSAHNITFENIRFEYTDAPRRIAVMKQADLDVSVTGDLAEPGPSQFTPVQAAAFAVTVVEITGAEQVHFNRCEISHVGEYGLGFKECANCTVKNSRFSDLGAGAVRIGNGTMDRNITVENCVMTQGGRYFAEAVAVWIGQNTEEISILHNDINDFYYTGVSVGWVWGYNGGHAFRNRIEFNKISKIGQGVLSDMGGVYTLGTSTGTRVCNNVIFDVSSYNYGGWGLYPDEGSEGILFENNLVYDTTDGTFHQHYGKDNVVRNNILARSKPNPSNPDENLAHQIAITRIEDHTSVVFENNIVYWKKGVALGYNASKAKAVFRKNLWFQDGGEATFDGKSHDEWSKTTEKDVDGIVADPLFVNPDENDFHLKPGSPAEKIGFVPFEYLKAGVVKE